MHPHRRVFMFHDPRHLHIHQRIVRDVEREGKVAQELAGSGAETRAGDAARACQDDQREQQQDAHRLVDAVRHAGREPADAGDRENRHQREGAPPEAAVDPDGGAARVLRGAARRQDPRDQQAAEQRVEQAREAHIDLRRIEAPAADHGVLRTVGEEAEHIPSQRQVEGEERAAGAEDAQCDLGQAPQHERIEDVADIFEEQRPGRAVEGVHLVPAADVELRAAGNQEEPHHQTERELPPFHFQRLGEGRSREEEQRCADHGTGDEHRVQARQTPLEVAPGGHPVPAVVIGVADDEAAQHEEEVDGQVAVVHDLRPENRHIGFKTVEDDDHQRRHAPQAVEYLIPRLGLQIYVRFCHR